MPVQPKQRPYAEIARKWRDLAERRRAHLADLQQSGRWQHYYSEAQFLGELRAAEEAVEVWAKIAPREQPVTEGSDGDDVRPRLPR